MTRGGRVKTQEEPLRRCLVTGAGQPKSELVRFVISPDRIVVPDAAGRLPGKGFYLVPDRAVMAKAVQKNLFAKAARAPVIVPNDLAERVEAALVQRLVETVSLARKAGQAVAGFERVRELIAAGKAAVVLHAADASPLGAKKLPQRDGLRYVSCLKAEELGLGFGRARVVHTALSSGALAERVVEEAAKLARLRFSESKALAVPKE